MDREGGSRRRRDSNPVRRVSIPCHSYSSHFPGSSVLHWAEGDGYLLTADTVMVQTSQRGFTFIWSAPNLVGPVVFLTPAPPQPRVCRRYSESTGGGRVWVCVQCVAGEGDPDKRHSHVGGECSQVLEEYWVGG